MNWCRRRANMDKKDSKKQTERTETYRESDQNTKPYDLNVGIMFSRTLLFKFVVLTHK